jgi:hypothetical protein
MENFEHDIEWLFPGDTFKQATTEYLTKKEWAKHPCLIARWHLLVALLSVSNDNGPIAFKSLSQKARKPSVVENFST